jgi:phenylacetic acid degradation operon negative regulatory protein
MLHCLIVANNIRTNATERATALQPLNARSIVLSVLLGSHPPHMPVGRILEFTTLFDVAPGTVRTALSRMVAAGELVNDDGTYRLTGRLVERQAQQDAGRHDPPSHWDGTWWTVAVVSDRRTMAERREFRSRASGSRLGELRPDLWLRPANIEIATDLPDVVITRGPLITGDGRELVARLWDLAELQRRSSIHCNALGAVATRLRTDAPDALADAFVALAGAQQFLRIEPQLPGELTRGGGAGTTLRSLYAEVLAEFQSQLAAFFRGESALLSTTAT